MATRRTRRKQGVRRTRVSTQTTLKVALSGSGSSNALGTRVREAAELIAAAAKADAAQVSRQIPASIRVAQGDDTHAAIYADSPNAYPIETGERHPLFGNRNFWYPMKQRRFLENGAVIVGSEAAEVLARVIDDWAAEAGFTE